MHIYSIRFLRRTARLEALAVDIFARNCEYNEKNLCSGSIYISVSGTWKFLVLSKLLLELTYELFEKLYFFPITFHHNNIANESL